MAATNPYADITVVPRIAIRLPLPLPIPPGFDARRPETWPEVEGSLEFVSGRLEYMPPCGEIQQRVVADVVGQLLRWRDAHPGFVVATNEAGMILGGDVRGADAAIWRATPAQPGFARIPPILAVEVMGKDEALDTLLDKAAWYIAHGVAVVWTVVPSTRRVLVTTESGTTEADDRIPEHPSLPALGPRVDDLFSQL